MSLLEPIACIIGSSLPAEGDERVRNENNRRNRVAFAFIKRRLRSLSFSLKLSSNDQDEPACGRCSRRGPAVRGEAEEGVTRKAPRGCGGRFDYAVMAGQQHRPRGPRCPAAYSDVCYRSIDS